MVVLCILLSSRCPNHLNAYVAWKKNCRVYTTTISSARALKEGCVTSIKDYTDKAMWQDGRTECFSSDNALVGLFQTCSTV